jgi:putative NIF3 family GTP cyclohydrolase 1 type 2
MGSQYGPKGPLRARRAGNKVKVHVNLDVAVTELLDVIAERMGDDPLYPVPSRSDLLNKTALLYIARCKERPDLKEAIEKVEQRAASAARIVALSGAATLRRGEKRAPSGG